ncbi:DNA polymerase III subunit delta' [Roseovarius sp. SYSU LYC5161]|uniref:DNA polymerase III subunit delta' n=1 Tax=Roseovarius halophilus (ex Wu et al. 2025) TaxID=3376060 RepID=UPI00399ABE19
MSDASSPEPDRVDGAPHPRETPSLIGQHGAETAFLDAYNAGRAHHAWLLTGPRGVGKATMAWAMARFLLAQDGQNAPNSLFGDAPARPASLSVAPDHPVARRILAGSEGGLYHITRKVNEKTGRLRDMIIAEDVRDLNQFLQLSAADGGRRVVIIDSADEMNTQAANALLKMLEEPPERTFLLLVSHQPSRLLPTIRSRCRALRLVPLGPADMERALDQAVITAAADMDALSELSAGSVGEAIRLVNLGGLELYAELVSIFGDLPRPERSRALKLAEAAATRGAEEKFALLLSLIDQFLSRLARTGATGAPPPREAATGEAVLLTRLAPSQAAARNWAECAQEIGARARHGRAVNLDPAALVLDTMFKIQRTATV